MVSYPSVSALDSSVGEERGEGLPKGEEKMGRGIPSQDKDDRQSLGAAVKTVS